MRLRDYDYDTADEIRYLSLLGRRPMLVDGHKMCRKDLLLSYIETAVKRHEWGMIDKHAALAHAHKLLANEFSTVPSAPRRGRPFKKEEAV